MMTENGESWGQLGDETDETALLCFTNAPAPAADPHDSLTVSPDSTDRCTVPPPSHNLIPSHLIPFRSIPFHLISPI